eukprot:356655-Hanusia_phi.AAC.1
MKSTTRIVNHSHLCNLSLTSSEQAQQTPKRWQRLEWLRVIQKCQGGRERGDGLIDRGKKRAEAREVGKGGVGKEAEGSRSKRGTYLHHGIGEAFFIAALEEARALSQASMPEEQEFGIASSRVQ